MCFITFEVYLEAGHAISRIPKGISECQESAYDVYGPLKAKIIKIHLVTSLFLCENANIVADPGTESQDRYV